MVPVDSAGRPLPGPGVSLALYSSLGRPEPQGKAWAHVDRRMRGDLRQAWAQVLRDRVEATPREARRASSLGPTPPPPEMPQGCAYCGVAEAGEWSQVTTYALTPGPHLLVAALCPACTEATQRVGAIGTRALAVAYTSARGLHYDEADPPLGLRAWAATGQPPSAEPWAHASGVRFREPAPTLADALARVAALEAEVAALRGEAS